MKKDSSLGSITELHAVDDATYSTENNNTAFFDRMELQHIAKDLLPKKHRTQLCFNAMVSGAESVVGWHHPESGGASLGNVIRCSNLWTCPICSAYQSERNRVRLSAASDIWQGSGFTLLLATFTLRHTSSQACRDVLSSLLDAHKKFWCDRTGRRLGEQFNIFGRVRGLEVTYGQNGWHAHVHAILFVRSDFWRTSDTEKLFSIASPYWVACLEKFGASGLEGRAFDVRHGSEAIAAYMTKFGGDDPCKGKFSDRWTLSHEATKGNQKSTHNAGYTPNGLLYSYAMGESWAGKKWLEYVDAFKGRSVLHWSPSLKSHLGEDVDAIVNELELSRGDKIAICDIPHFTWRYIVKHLLIPDLMESLSDGSESSVRRFADDNDVEGILYYSQKPKMWTLLDHHLGFSLQADRGRVVELLMGFESADLNSVSVQFPSS